LSVNRTLLKHLLLKPRILNAISLCYTPFAGSYKPYDVKTDDIENFPVYRTSIKKRKKNSNSLTETTYDRCHPPVVRLHLSINTGNSRIISYKTGKKKLLKNAQENFKGGSARSVLDYLHSYGRYS